MRFILLFFLITIQLFANDQAYNRGEMLYFSKGCSGCHGPDAEGSTTYPKLANKKAAYLLQRLEFFKSGKVITVSQQMMAQFIEQLSKQEVKDLTHFLANHKKGEVEDVPDDLLGGYGS
ncbi:MAG: c-type cytochrome [Sulfurimonas sp.]